MNQVEAKPAFINTNVQIPEKSGNENEHPPTKGQKHPLFRFMKEINHKNKTYTEAGHFILVQFLFHVEENNI